MSYQIEWYCGGVSSAAPGGAPGTAPFGSTVQAEAVRQRASGLARTRVAALRGAGAAGLGDHLVAGERLGDRRDRELLDPRRRLGAHDRTTGTGGKSASGGTTGSGGSSASGGSPGSGTGSRAATGGRGQARCGWVDDY